MICKHCGKTHPENINFCPETGKKIPKEKNNICPKCGMIIPAGGNFCPACSYKLSRKPPLWQILNSGIILIGLILFIYGSILVYKDQVEKGNLWPTQKLSTSTSAQNSYQQYISSQYFYYQKTVFSENNQLIGVISNNRLYIYDRTTSKLLQIIETKYTILSFQFLSDNQYVAIFNNNNQILLWRLSDNMQRSIYEQASCNISAFSVSPDNNNLAVACDNGDVLIWSMIPNRVLYKINCNAAKIRFVQISPDGKTLITCSSDNSIRLWDIETEILLQEITLPGDELSNLIFSNDGLYIYTISEDGVSVIETDTGALVQSLDTCPGTKIAQTSDGYYLVCNCEGYLEIWSIRKGELVQKTALRNGSIADFTLSETEIIVTDLQGNIWSQALNYNSTTNYFSQSEVLPNYPLPSQNEIAVPTQTNPAPTNAQAILLATKTPVQAVATPMPQNTKTITPQPTKTPSPTTTQTPTKTETPTVTQTPTQSYIDLMVNPKDNAEIVLVPEGDFIMGSNSDDPYFWGAEAPEHYVYLDTYWIYRTEVTNAMYAQCVADKACPVLDDISSKTRGEYYGNPHYEDYPVIYVTWTHAQSYCVWAGGRLPTEAQWEKAARGTDGRMFPWGDETLSGELANFCDETCSGSERLPSLNDGYADTSPVGSFPAGVSPYGAYDMAGNVWEWCYDYFAPEYYKNSPYENPLGPASSRHRVIRGGSFQKINDGVRAAVRYAVNPTFSLETLGFRCVINDTSEIE